jgi:hypothetical protein
MRGVVWFYPCTLFKLTASITGWSGDCDLMPLPKQKQGSFYKGLLTFYLIFLAIFFAAAPFLTVLLYAETDLSLSLLPQLIGFCLQGAFLVVVFSIYEKRSNFKNKRSHKIALRTFLSVFINPCLESGPDDGELFSSPALFEEGLEKLRSNSMDEKMATHLKQVATQNVTSMESLTVLAAQINHTHLEVWSMILHESRDIRDSVNQDETRKATIRLLENVQKFDEIILY